MGYGPLNIFTLNVQGLNTPNKPTKAFLSFASAKAHVVCLQETHFTAQSTPKFFGHQYCQAFAASASSKKREVLIAFYRTTLFLLEEIRDRYFVLTRHLLDSEVTIVSYYASNKHSI